MNLEEYITKRASALGLAKATAEAGSTALGGLASGVSALGKGIGTKAGGFGITGLFFGLGIGGALNRVRWGEQSTIRKRK